MGIAATISSPPLGLGRALLLVAVSLLLHVFVLSGLRSGLVAPAADTEAPPRTIEAALIVQAPPAPPPPKRPPAPRRVARPKPPPPPPTVAAAEPAPAIEAIDLGPPRAAPGEGDTQLAELAAPAVPEVDLALVQPKPAEPATEPAPAAQTRALDLVAEMNELGGGADALPANGSYVYTMRDSRYSALSGTTTIEWHLDPAKQRYETRLRSTVFGIALADISSVGTIRRSGLAPERYVQKTGTRAPQAANLDWERRVVTFSSRTFQRPASEGMQDRLSFQFQLMALAQSLPNAFRTGATISMEVAGPGDVETYHFLVVGPETIETGTGPIEALKLDRARIDGAKARIEVWLAPSRRYLPIRLRFTDQRENVTESLLESANESG